MKTTKEIKKGDSFSCWEVIEPGGTTSQCRCQCGLIKEVSNWHLVRGKTKSCGCKRLEFISKAHIKHGLTHSKEYATWLGIRKRCDPANASIPRYKRYAGRGIKVCDRWLHSFENFLADMGPRPAGMSIERKKNDGDYSPDNCIWADKFTQARNTSASVFLEKDGLRLTIGQWCKRLGVGIFTVRHRLNRGLSVYDALTPGKLNRKTVTYE